MGPGRRRLITSQSRRRVTLAARAEPARAPAERQSVMKEWTVPKNKVVPIEEAMSHVTSGMSIAVGGFIGQGDPLTLIDYMKTMDVKDLTIYENDAGYKERGVVELVRQGKIKKVVASHVGTTPYIGQAMNQGILEVEVVPQGTLAERMRCGGAGLGGFLTPTGVGTTYGESRDEVELDGRKYLLERALKCDVAIIRAHAGDTWGNLIYRGTSRNFNVPAATCADYVIAEVENVYVLGELDPNAIHTPGIFVDAVVRANIDYCIMREEVLTNA
jgi:acetate CoA/acetoacetate CoA-transferase alpha subunit